MHAAERFGMQIGPTPPRANSCREPLHYCGSAIDRVRMKLPWSSLERFESLARSLYGLRRGFRVGDINSVLKAL
jgi:hypothetical protein